ncbi:MAG: acetyl-CoA carboxylase biotin carboxylase subunit, partial [Gammaproteobacteria bacterium]
KLIAHGESRTIALARMINALTEIVIDGIKTNLPLHRNMMNDEGFRAGAMDIHYLEKKLGLA